MLACLPRAAQNRLYSINSMCVWIGMSRDTWIECVSRHWQQMQFQVNIARRRYVSRHNVGVRSLPPNPPPPFHKEHPPKSTARSIQNERHIRRIYRIFIVSHTSIALNHTSVHFVSAVACSVFLCGWRGDEWFFRLVGSYEQKSTQCTYRFTHKYVLRVNY